MNALYPNASYACPFNNRQRLRPLRLFVFECRMEDATCVELPSPKNYSCEKWTAGGSGAGQAVARVAAAASGAEAVSGAEVVAKALEGHKQLLREAVARRRRRAQQGDAVAAEVTAGDTPSAAGAAEVTETDGEGEGESDCGDYDHYLRLLRRHAQHVRSLSSTPMPMLTAPLTPLPRPATWTTPTQEEPHERKCHVHSGAHHEDERESNSGRSSSSSSRTSKTYTPEISFLEASMGIYANLDAEELPDLQWHDASESEPEAENETKAQEEEEDEDEEEYEEARPFFMDHEEEETWNDTLVPKDSGTTERPAAEVIAPPAAAAAERPHSTTLLEGNNGEILNFWQLQEDVQAVLRSLDEALGDDDDDDDDDARQDGEGNRDLGEHRDGEDRELDRTYVLEKYQDLERTYVLEKDQELERTYVPEKDQELERTHVLEKDRHLERDRDEENRNLRDRDCVRSPGQNLGDRHREGGRDRDLERDREENRGLREQHPQGDQNLEKDRGRGEDEPRHTQEGGPVMRTGASIAQHREHSEEGHPRRASRVCDFHYCFGRRRHHEENAAGDAQSGLEERDPPLPTQEKGQVPAMAEESAGSEPACDTALRLRVEATRSEAMRLRRLMLPAAKTDVTSDSNSLRPALQLELLVAGQEGEGLLLHLSERAAATLYEDTGLPASAQRAPLVMFAAHLVPLTTLTPRPLAAPPTPDPTAIAAHLQPFAPAAVGAMAGRAAGGGVGPLSQLWEVIRRVCDAVKRRLCGWQPAGPVAEPGAAEAGAAEAGAAESESESEAEADSEAEAELDEGEAAEAVVAAWRNNVWLRGYITLLGLLCALSPWPRAPAAQAHAKFE